MSTNPGNTHTLHRQLIRQIFDGAQRQFDALDANRPLIAETQRLLDIMNDAGAAAGQRFEPEVRLLQEAKAQIVTYGPHAVADVLGTVLRAGLNYCGTTPGQDGEVAIRVVGFAAPVVVYKPVLDCLEAA